MTSLPGGLRCEDLIAFDVVPRSAFSGAVRWAFWFATAARTNDPGGASVVAGWKQAGTRPALYRRAGIGQADHRRAGCCAPCPRRTSRAAGDTRSGIGATLRPALCGLCRDWSADWTLQIRRTSLRRSGGCALDTAALLWPATNRCAVDLAGSGRRTRTSGGLGG